MVFRRDSRSRPTDVADNAPLTFFNSSGVDPPVSPGRSYNVSSPYLSPVSSLALDLLPVGRPFSASLSAALGLVDISFSFFPLRLFTPASPFPSRRRTLPSLLPLLCIALHVACRKIHEEQFSTSRSFAARISRAFLFSRPYIPPSRHTPSSVSERLTCFLVT